MDVFDAIEKRRSIRKYKDKPVPEEMINKLLESARLAPSTSNTQTWRFKLVSDDESRGELCRAAHGQKFVREAPLIIACCVDFDAFREQGRRALDLVVRRGVKPSMGMLLHYAKKDPHAVAERKIINGTMNVSIAVEHIALAATAMGLGTCWIRAFDVDRAQEVLDLPQGVVLLCLMTVGYPDHDPAPRPRKSLEEITL